MIKIIKQIDKHIQVECWYGYYKENHSTITLHREDGPAWIWKKSYKGKPLEWWWHGEQLSVSSQEEFERWLKYNPF